MSAYTPGEWSVHARPDGSGYGHHVTSHGLTICAVTYQFPDSNGESERIANARLIAAAPDLLAALKLAVRQNSHDMQMTGEELRQCEAAIAKATGE